MLFTNSFLFVTNSFRILSFSVTTTSSAKRLRCLKYQAKHMHNGLGFDTYIQYVWKRYIKN